MREYAVVHAERAVRVRCSAQTANILSAISRPYFEVHDHSRFEGLARWTVILSKPPSHGLLLEVVTEGYRAGLSNASDTIYVDLKDSVERDAQSLLRVVRAILRREFLLAESGLCLHSAIVGKADSSVGLAISGKKMSGKTSAMLRALAGGGADFVTNDDAILVRRGGQLEGVGWPRSINVRTGGADVLGSRAQLRMSHPENDLNESLGRACILRPSELAERFRCKVVPKVFVPIAVFPEFSTTRSVTKLPARAAFEALVRNIESSPSYADGWMDYLFPQRSDSRFSAREALDSLECISVKSRNLEELGDSVNGILESL